MAVWAQNCGKYCLLRTISKSISNIDKEKIKVVSTQQVTQDRVLRAVSKTFDYKLSGSYIRA